MVNALVTLASMYQVNWQNHEPTIRIMHFDQPANCLSTEEEYDDKPWFYDIKRYLKSKNTQ